MDTKQCVSCKEIKSLEQFGQQKRGLCGRRSKCKCCVNKYNHEYHMKKWCSDAEYRSKKINMAMEWVKKNPEKRAIIAKKRNKKAIQQSPDKVRARALVNQRVRFKRIPRASDLQCSNCGTQAKHYHHHMGYDWENRYNVIPVCIECHNLLDMATE